ncbi:MAG TPA: RNA polymerase sporulation sigma factor SigH, partial [Clostridiales bacterium]|nr:RNA polymerase sporulation sigma factor SigH [Clostridiales bacterium]
MKKMVVDYLSDLEKRVLHYYLKGLSYGEIADKTGIPIKSTDNALQRIKKKLNRAMTSAKNS